MIIYRWSLIVAATVLVLWVIVNVASAHEWYENECCSDGDCQLAPSGSVEWTQGGWLVKRGLKNPEGAILQSDVLVPFDDKRVRPLPSHVPPGLHICTSAFLVYCIYLDGGT